MTRLGVVPLRGHATDLACKSAVIRPLGRGVCLLRAHAQPSSDEAQSAATPASAAEAAGQPSVAHESHLVGGPEASGWGADDNGEWTKRADNKPSAGVIQEPSKTGGLLLPLPVWPHLLRPC